MNIRIQRITPNDVALFDNIAPEVYDEPVQPDRLEAYLAQPTNRLLLAIEETPDGDLVVGQCAAVLHLHPDKVTELYIDELGTASTHRRRGIGRRLTREMIAWGKELGCGEGWLGTELDNVPARSLYETLWDEGEKIVMYDFDIE
ncbi:MAG: GNAT family N-acetyltransferase [Acidobacteriota bacterium]